MAIKKGKIGANAGFVNSSQMDNILVKMDDAVKNIEAIPRRLIAFHENNDFRELDSDDTIRTLADSIRREGLLHNLVVVKRKTTTPDGEEKQYVLISGERRLRAINLLCKEDDEFLSQFTTVPCNVINEKRFQLSDKDKSRLSEAGMTEEKIRLIQEQILVDGANLQSRGGVGDEAQQRKATARYAENVMLIYGLSQQEADKLTISISSQSVRTTQRNLAIERKATESVKNLLDKGAIDKMEASQYATLDESSQEAVADALRRVTGVGDKLPAETVKAAKKALSDAMATRNSFERKENLDAAIEEIHSTAATVEAQGGKEATTADVQRAKYLDKISAMRKKVGSLSSKKNIHQMAALDQNVSEEDSIAYMIDGMIHDLQDLKRSIKAATKG